MRAEGKTRPQSWTAQSDSPQRMMPVAPIASAAVGGCGPGRDRKSATEGGIGVAQHTLAVNL